MPSLKLAGAVLVLGGAAAFQHGPGLPTDMFKGPAGTGLAAPPAGAMSTAGEALLARGDAGDILKNPLPATPETLARGARLFEIYCAICHGPQGQGDGPVGKKFGMPLPPLNDPAVAERPDGYLYGTIREGGFVMPSYGEMLTPDERWAVVHHVRSLQKR